MPTWNTHRVLVDKAWPESLPRGELYRGVMRGVVEPDVEEDRVYVERCRRGRCRRSEARPAHHKPQPDLVEYYYNLAHYHRARGDLYNAGRALGRALHYVHDGAVKTKKWLILDVHDEVEQRMDALAAELPHICREAKPGRSNNPVDALCYAYQQTKTLLARFAQEAVTPDAARAYRRRGLKKKIYLALAGAAVTAAGVALVTHTSPLLILIGGAASLSAVTWTPRDYIIAMRGGALCLKPRRAKPAMTCEGPPNTYA
ncbi:MAG: hypothetical protein ACPL3C_06375 [Pyrobaculum sp.]